MPSDLWLASAHGDLHTLADILSHAGPADIEEKDQDGVTPLIAAVKNGHHDVVKALLDHGANPAHASSHGLPEQYTSDAAIVELLRAAAVPKMNPDAPPQDPGFTHDPSVGPPKAYYMPPPGPYAYYPGMPVPSLPDGAIPYYPPPSAPAPPAGSPPSADEQAPSPHPGGPISNLPPPEIARLIPCRYFPACRYGASCMFAHPQAPYYPGPMPPPAQFPTHYDQPPYPPNYYQPPPFQPPNGPRPRTTSPPSRRRALQPLGRADTPPPAPGPYGPLSPISPSSYPLHQHAPQLPVPLTVPPPPPTHASPTGPQSPTAPYPAQPPPPQPPIAHARYPGMPPEPNGAQKSPQQEGFAPRGGDRRAGAGMGPGPGFRRPSFGGSRKPPCLFFPSGRCRNGDDCRFPHVLDGHVVGRGSRFRSPPQGALNAAAGQAHLEEKLASLSVTEGSSGSTTPSERGPRAHAHANGHAHPHPRAPKPPHHPAAPRQRVPNDDDFPVLGGAATPPLVPGAGAHAHAGPTAAQVLQAAVPRKAEEEQFRAPGAAVGQAAAAAAKASAPVPEPVLGHAHVVGKLPVSFAAVANGAPDTSKEVSVSA
ncbi:hypothetical protein BC834DRAFT_965733 [Gloeopeniophorella convolvens]|nr:hypothetical protein BC834DRAFT_965733 [Gloeopeniophorella convolvens]